MHAGSIKAFRVEVASGETLPVSAASGVLSTLFFVKFGVAIAYTHSAFARAGSTRFGVTTSTIGRATPSDTYLLVGAVGGVFASAYAGAIKGADLVVKTVHAVDAKAGNNAIAVMAVPTEALAVVDAAGRLSFRDLGIAVSTRGTSFTESAGFIVARNRAAIPPAELTGSTDCSRAEIVCPGIDSDRIKHLSARGFITPIAGT